MLWEENGLKLRNIETTGVAKKNWEFVYPNTRQFRAEI